MQPARPHARRRRLGRRVVRLVAFLNLAYFGIEFAIARAIGSVSLFADSIDFLEDAGVNMLTLVALGWTAQKRARVGMALAGILFIPGLATLCVLLAMLQDVFDPGRHIVARAHREQRAASADLVCVVPSLGLVDASAGQGVEQATSGGTNTGAGQGGDKPAGGHDWSNTGDGERPQSREMLSSGGR